MRICMWAKLKSKRIFLRKNVEDFSFDLIDFKHKNITFFLKKFDIMTDLIKFQTYPTEKKCIFS